MTVRSMNPGQSPQKHCLIWARGRAGIMRLGETSSFPTIHLKSHSSTYWQWKEGVYIGQEGPGGGPGRNVKLESGNHGLWKPTCCDSHRSSVGSVEFSAKTIYDSAFPHAGGEDGKRGTSSTPGKSTGAKQIMSCYDQKSCSCLLVSENIGVTYLCTTRQFHRIPFSFILLFLYKISAKLEDRRHLLL